MPTYDADVATEWAPEEAFAYLAEFSRAAEWDPGVARAERLDAGPLRVGSAFRLWMRVGRRTAPLDYRVADLDPPRRVVLAGENAWVRSVDTVTVADAPGGGAQLHYHAELVPRGLARVAAPLVGPAFRRIGDRGIAGLRRALAGPWPGGRPGGLR